MVIILGWYIITASVSNLYYSMHAPMTLSFVLIHSPNPCVQSIETSPGKKHRPEAVEAEGDASTTSTEARIGEGLGILDSIARAGDLWGIWMSRIPSPRNPIGKVYKCF